MSSLFSYELEFHHVLGSDNAKIIRFIIYKTTHNQIFAHKKKLILLEYGFENCNIDKCLTVVNYVK